MRRTNTILLPYKLLLCKQFACLSPFWLQSALKPPSNTRRLAVSPASDGPLTSHRPRLRHLGDKDPHMASYASLALRAMHVPVVRHAATLALFALKKDTLVAKMQVEQVAVAGRAARRLAVGENKDPATVEDVAKQFPTRLMLPSLPKNKRADPPSQLRPQTASPFRPSRHRLHPSERRTRSRVPRLWRRVGRPPPRLVSRVPARPLAPRPPPRAGTLCDLPCL